MKKIEIKVVQGQVFTRRINVPDNISAEDIDQFIITHGLHWETVDKHSSYESDTEISDVTDEYPDMSIDIRERETTGEDLSDFLLSYVEASTVSVCEFLANTPPVEEGTCEHCGEENQNGNYCSNCGEEM